MKILKQKLEITDERVYTLPGWKIKPIHVAEQRGELVMYFETDAEPDDIINDVIHGAKKHVTTVYVRGTGNDEPDVTGANYLGTVMRSSGFVWHVYFKDGA